MILLYCWMLLGLADVAPIPRPCVFVEGTPDDTTVHYVDGKMDHLYDPLCYLALTPVESNEALPMIVLLHGLGDSAVGLARSPIVEQLREDMKQGRFPPAYILIPEGERGYWTNWLTSETIQHGALQIDQLYENRLLGMVQEAQRHYPVISDKVALVGISMGGFGALSIGLRHPQMFSAIVAMSPTDMEIAVKEQPDSFLYNQIYGSPIYLPYVAAMNPRELIVRGAGKGQLLAWVYGSAELDKFKKGAERLQAAAEVNGLQPEIRVVPEGGHSFADTWGGETVDWWIGLLREWCREE